MSTATPQSGVFGNVYLGANQVLGPSKYTASGHARKVLDGSQFGNDIDIFGYGTLDPGTISIPDVIVDPTDVNGQGALDAAIENCTEFGPGDIKFMRGDGVGYYTIGTGGKILITKAGPTGGVDRNGLEKTSYEFKLSGALLVLNSGIVSIAVTPDSPSKAPAATQQFVATATLQDETTLVITTKVIWASATKAKVIIDKDGLAIAVAAGTSVISATLHEIVGTTTMTVTA